MFSTPDCVLSPVYNRLHQSSPSSLWHSVIEKIRSPNTPFGVTPSFTIHHSADDSIDWCLLVLMVLVLEVGGEQSGVKIHYQHMLSQVPHINLNYTETLCYRLEWLRESVHHNWHNNNLCHCPRSELTDLIIGDDSPGPGVQPQLVTSIPSQRTLGTRLESLTVCSVTTIVLLIKMTISVIAAKVNILVRNTALVMGQSSYASPIWVLTWDKYSKYFIALLFDNAIAR